MRTLDKVYPPDVFIAPRLMDNVARWTQQEMGSGDFLSGNLMVCAGSTPILVHKSVMSPDGLTAMADSGLPLGSRLDVYDSLDDYIGKALRRVAAGERPATVFSDASGSTLAGSSYVPNETLQFLNNKANTALLAGDGRVPKRSLVKPPFGESSNRFPTPVVIKVASSDPSAGGADVVVCRARRHKRRALRRFADAPALVFEQFIDAVANWCVQFEVNPEGDVRFSGAARQICLRNGIYAGNLIVADKEPSHAVLEAARRTAIAGAEHGFRGICGMDVLEDSSGAVFLIDLNYRPVASSTFVRVAADEMARRNARVARLAFAQYDGLLTSCLRACKVGIDEGWLLPLATFDPVHGGLEREASKLRLMLLANDEQQLDEREKGLIEAGLAFVTLRETQHERPRRRGLMSLLAR